MAHIHRRFDRIDDGLEEVHERLDRLQRTIVYGFALVGGVILAGDAAVMTLVLART